MADTMDLRPNSRQDDDDDDDIDETLAERLWGLTEMFPEPMQKVVANVANVSCTLMKSGYSTGRNLLWILASTATIMALPVVFESERASQQEQQMQHQRQILLGPNAAIAGAAGSGNLLPGMGMMPSGMPK